MSEYRSKIFGNTALNTYINKNSNLQQDRKKSLFNKVRINFQFCPM